MTVTKSIDHVVFEITEEKGIEYVSVCRYTSSGKSNLNFHFLRGDKIAGAQVLNQVGELIGYGKVAEIDGEAKR